MPVEAPVPQGSPLMKAWEAYKSSPEFANSKAWAMRLAPLKQAGDPSPEDWMSEILPKEQRETFVMGAIWAAFAAGFLNTHHNQAPIVNGIPASEDPPSLR
jgi:hypothetical protein